MIHRITHHDLTQAVPDICRGKTCEDGRLQRLGHCRNVFALSYRFHVMMIFLFRRPREALTVGQGEFMIGTLHINNFLWRRDIVVKNR